VSDAVQTDEIFQRVEQMLDTLSALDKSSTDFQSECEALQDYLVRQASGLTPLQNLSADRQERLNSIINKLYELQKRAEIKAAIPSDLQKYIAERSD
jgi:septal ring factor EnvC (AmiA/AmiB activator)